jgi:hypothetical protein
MTRTLCSNEKAFISIQEFNSLAFDSDEPIMGKSYPILFDTLRSLDQITSFRNYLCNNKFIDCFGFISLKYYYKQDTINIPAFNCFCDDCAVSFDPPHIIHICLRNDSILIKDYYSEVNISMETYKDTLETIFSRSIGGFFQLWKSRKSYIDNADSLRAYSYSDNSFIWFLYIEISNDSQILGLKKYIDIAYDIYLGQLRNNLESIYQTNVCDLSSNELNIFTQRLFFPISIYKYQPITIIDSLETP